MHKVLQIIQEYIIVHKHIKKYTVLQKQKQKQEKHIQPQPQMFTEPLPGRRWQLQAEPNVPGALPCSLPRKPTKRKSHIPAAFTPKNLPPKALGSLGILSMSCPFSLLGALE